MKFRQIYRDGNVLSLIIGIKDGRFTARSIKPLGLLPDVSVKVEEAGTIRRYSMFGGETIFEVLFSLGRNEFERLMGYDANDRLVNP